MLKISAKHSQDLIVQLSNINATVPERTKGRKTEHVELWTAIRFLATYANSNFLSYPIEIVHRDKPDFLIKKPNDNIGVEITESIPEQYAYIFALSEKHFPKANIEPSMFTRDIRQRSKKELLKILEKSQKKLIGLPIGGDKIERDWAEWINETVISKTEKLNSRDFERFVSNYLLIYDNLPNVATKLNTALQYLEPLADIYWKNRENNSLTFDSIYILTGSYIVELLKDSQSINQINDLWER